MSPPSLKGSGSRHKRANLALAERVRLANPIDAETYIGAIERHLTLWAAGEDLDEQPGGSHLAHIRACCGILMDAIDAGTLIDNRRGTPSVLAVMDRYDASSMPVVKPVEGAPGGFAS